MTDELLLTEKVVLKAQRALDPLRIEMAVNKWPAEFRAIMWEAVADTAKAMAKEASPTPTQGGQDGWPRWKPMSAIPDYVDCPSYILVWNECNGTSEIGVDPEDIWKFRDGTSGWRLWRPVPRPSEKEIARVLKG